ncbi:dipeptide ABC transporter ATP-binding protein [Phytoactinopolyspora halotolerans]|uniref:ABC transporter ATP-binding protein n=1 Tax=Phytoactinopolyspora halotolerans TaxID=1981512 RepID=A0A6L9SGJ9_9ACTN|nr:ABC transporter ATP-binding protein [Phytoactinopolyspora halotolerans]NEE03230.1 ABC transporter ATP-binding protein [Phytoactinopolyspora halotolerans]
MRLTGKSPALAAAAATRRTERDWSADAPLLQVRGLRTEFATDAGTVRAVNDVDLAVQSGTVLGVVGESGSGKSVTARSIMRMVHAPGRIVAGEILFDGRDLRRLTEEQMREVRGREIAMVFQDPQSALNPVMTVGDQIAEALIVHGADKRTARARALELLQQVGIPDAERRISEYPHQFSGGMRQRVVIAIALAGSPKLLIADEPTTALDVTIQAQILRLLARLKDELGVAVLMITHDMGVVAETCDDVVVMYGGRVVERGPAEALFAHQEHPYTADLLRAMPRIDEHGSGNGNGGGTSRDKVSRSQGLPAIPGTPPDPADLPPGCAFHPRCRLAEDQCRTDVPELLARTHSTNVDGGDRRGGRAAACWITQRGDAIPPLPRLIHAESAPAGNSSQPAASRVATTEVGAVEPGTVEPGAIQPHAGGAARPGSGSPMLAVEDLRVNVAADRRTLFGRPDPVYAVDGVSLSVAGGETLGLVGESGCGKSTLARTVVGINRPSSGTVRVGPGQVDATTAGGVQSLRSTVQYVFQDPYASLNPRRSVRQSLDEALEMRGVPRSQRAGEATELIRRVGLNENHLDRYPHAFSGGQRQRIGIARALAVQPRVLICDEPVSALDVSIQAQIINLLEQLRDDLGLGYLFIAHDLSVVRHLSDRVAVMYLGKIVETGPVDAVYSAPQHPYTVALMSSSPVPDTTARDRERIVLTGDLPSPKNPPSGCRFRTRCPIGPLAHPERQICVEQEPALSVTADGQRAACHFAGEMRPAHGS